MDDSLALELPSNGTGFCNRSTKFREGGTHLWARTIAIVSEGLDKNSNPVTGVALVVHFLVDNPFESLRAAGMVRAKEFDLELLCDEYLAIYSDLIAAAHEAPPKATSLRVRVR